LASGVAHQVRTTVDPALLDEAAVARMGAELAALGVTRHILQEFRLAGTRADRPVHDWGSRESTSLADPMPACGHIAMQECPAERNPVVACSRGGPCGLAMAGSVL